jgi:hypothetical protein
VCVCVYQLINEGRVLLGLVLDKLVLAPLADFEERLTCHVLHPRVRFVLSNSQKSVP